MDDSVSIRASLTNLTQLWMRMGVGQRRVGSRVVWYSKGWPFRVWVEWGELGDGLDSIHPVVAAQSASAVVPLWNKAMDHEGEARALEQLGYEAFMTQTVMMLKAPALAIDATECADIFYVRTLKDAQRWSDIVSASFGYFVDGHAVGQLLHATGVTLVILHVAEQDIGSACVFYDEGIAGVHYVGVLPPYRRNGMATRLMRTVIQLCCNLGAACVTLQASPQAVDLYKKMGFVELFKYKNYRFAGSHA